MTATGGRGPNLVAGVLSRGDSDDSIRQVIRIGVPGTTMPAFADLTSEELAQIISYLRSLSTAGASEQVTGDPPAGKQVYAKSGCAGCHRIGDQGSIYGPDLSHIGAARSVAYIKDSIVNPSADVPEAYEGVTAVLKDGKRIRGLRINEDTFTLQMRSQDGKLHMFDKSQLQDVIYSKESIMPPYKMAAADLDNLVAYLHSLRAAADASAGVKKAGGIK